MVDQAKIISDNSSNIGNLETEVNTESSNNKQIFFPAFFADLWPVLDFLDCE